MIHENTAELRPPLHYQLIPNLAGQTLVLKAQGEINDASWGARFGVIQNGLRNKRWDDQKITKCHLDLMLCTWADPLPLLSLAITLSEFEQANGQVAISLPEKNSPSLAHRQFLKFIAREGFLDLLAHPLIIRLPSHAPSSIDSFKRPPARKVKLGSATLDDGLLDDLKQLNVPLAFERSTCLPAIMLRLTNPLTGDGNKTLDEIDQWVERKFYDAIAPVVSDMVPSWAHRGLRKRLLVALREALHNIAEHAYETSGLAAIYVRYREGALGEAPVAWQRLEKFIHRESNDSEVPLMGAPSEHESFPKTRPGFFELFILDAGGGLCGSLGELKNWQEESPLHQCMLDIFDKGRGRRERRPTQYGGIFLLRQLLEPSRDYLRIRDEDAWWGTELPLKRTEDGSTPKGKITVSARGKEHVGKSVEGVAWTIRLSWLEPTDLVCPQGPWQGLVNEEDKIFRDALLEILSSEKSTSELENQVAVLDCRFPFKNWSNGNSPDIERASTLLILPRADWAKSHIQWEITNSVHLLSSAKTISIVIADIPSEEATIYLAAIRRSNRFCDDPLLKVNRIVLVTRDLKACVLTRDKDFKLDCNSEESHTFIRGSTHKTDPTETLAACFSFLRWHNGRRFWEIVLNEGGAFLNEKVNWNDKIVLDGYLDFSQSVTHPVCREIYSIALQHLKGLFPRHECEVVGLDGLVDSLVVRFNAQQHPRWQQDRSAIRLNIGSVKVSGLTEGFGKDEGAPVFHFFRHPSGPPIGRHLLPWLVSAPMARVDSKIRYSRVGRTSVIANDGWKAYQMPRYNANGQSIYAQAPKESYRAWQEPSRTPLKLGHWSYGGHHDLLTLNLLLAFDTELDRISVALGGSLARFIYANLFRTFGLTEDHLNEKGQQILEAVSQDNYRKLLPAELGTRNPLLLYPSHPVTDHVIDKFLSLLSDVVSDGQDRSPLDAVRVRLVAILPIRRHRSGSGLQISGLILERLKCIPTPRPPVVLFDDAFISGRTYADLKRLLRSLGFEETYSLAMVDRQRFASADHVDKENHYCYWRLDLPSLGGNHNCPLCNARRRVGDLSDDLTQPKHRERVESWRNSWRPLNPATEWGDGGLHPIPVSLNKPERKFSIELDPERPGKYRQIGGNDNMITLTNTAGLVAYVSELHSVTSHDDLAMRLLKKEKLSPEGQIQLLTSQLLLFAGEFDRDLAYDLGRELLGALWEAESHDRHTALAVLTLVGCGDVYLKEVVIQFFSKESRRTTAVTRNIDLTLMLAMVLVIEKSTRLPDSRLAWLQDLDSVRGLLKPENKIELYGWLHRVVRDNSGKPHSTPLHRLKDFAEDPDVLTSELLKNILNSVTRFQSIVERVLPYWLRDDCDGHKKYESIQNTVNEICAGLYSAIDKLLNGGNNNARRQVLKIAKELAANLFDEASKLHHGVFFPLDISMIKSEREYVEPRLLEALRKLPFSVESMIINWHSPSPSDLGEQIKALNKPGLHEAYMLWDAGLVEALKDILTNVRHAEGNLSDPWDPKSDTRANLWGRVTLQERFVCIDLCNCAHNPLKVSKVFNLRLSPSRAFLSDSGGKLTCQPWNNDRVLTSIFIPYAHTIRPTHEEPIDG